MPFKVQLQTKPIQSQVMRMVETRVERGVVVIATETPVDRYDDKRGLYREVLLMSGVRFRGGRNQIPIVDSHDDSTVRNILGSVRSLTIDRDAGELYGEYKFSATEDAKATEVKIAEGHLTDFSITAMPLNSKWIDRGQTYVTERGEVIEGPANIITEWEPHNASVCATGADVNSVVRRSYTDIPKRSERMDDAFKEQLVSLGLPEGVTDPAQIIAFLLPLASIAKGQEGSLEPVVNPPVEMVESAEASMPVMPEEEVQNMDEKVKEEVARALAVERKRRADIISDCTLAKLERSFADKLCDTGVSADEARKHILKEVSNRQAVTHTFAGLPQGDVSAIHGDTNFDGVEGDRFTVTRSQSEKVTDAMRDALVHRSMSAARIKSAPQLSQESKAFANLGMFRMASAYMRSAGAPVDNMSKQDIARAALGNRSVLERYRIQRDAWHTRGSFANLMLDAANKTLLAAYEEAPYSWSLWARQAASVEDFKPVNRIRFSEAPDLEAVPETKPYPEKTMSDSRESYSVQKYGALFTVSWETIVNDDLDAISRVPAMHGNAARRLQNKKVYEILTSNPTMGDTFPLFSASHPSGTNQSGSAGAPAVGTLNTAFQSMMVQRGLNSGVILNIQPRYLIVPAALSATALELISSASYAVVNGNSGITNIYGTNGQRPITVVVEPVLDGNSPSVWYMAADPSQIDTVELAFLSGEESPVLESEVDFDTDTYKYKVRQTFGVAAIDWRGLYRNS